MRILIDENVPHSAVRRIREVARGRGHKIFRVPLGMKDPIVVKHAKGIRATRFITCDLPFPNIPSVIVLRYGLKEIRKKEVGKLMKEIEYGRKGLIPW